MFAQCSYSDGVYGFPFVGYLLEATITILACLSRIPTLKSAYRDITELALKLLNRFCKKTWVSGKMARIIYKLGDIIPRVFANRHIPTPLMDASNPTSPVIATPQPINSDGANNNPSNTTNFIPDGAMLGCQHQPLSTNNPWHMYQPLQKKFQPLGQFPQSYGSGNMNAQSQASGLFNGGNDVDGAGTAFQPSMIADFPFELNFGNAGLHAQGQNDDFSTHFLSLEDLDWVDEVVRQENRLLAFA
jgi:hypothetical protein